MLEIRPADTFKDVMGFFNMPMKPLRFEADIYDCEVVGEIPAELQGRFYRTGPDRQYPSLQGDVIINGDGIFSMFRFENGHVDFKTRYVKTERFLRERQARRRLYGSYRNPFTDEPEAAGVDRNNTANTSAFFHSGRLFALREDSLPHQIDVDTLETLPKWNFNGKLESVNLTAHPKIDPVTGEWVSYAMYAHGQPNADGRINTDMMLHVIDKSGELYRQEAFEAPIPGFSHDFAVTREHFIFQVLPLIVDIDRMRAGGSFYSYDPSIPSYFGIMPRAGSVRDIRWFKVPHMFGHMVNAFSENTKVYVDAVVCPGNIFSFFPAVDGSYTNPADAIGMISRLTFDLSSPDDGAKVAPFAGAVGEFPRIDERYAMTRYRYAFFTAMEGVSRLDLETGEITRHQSAVAPSFCQEPMFVPRHADGPEGDGFILCLLNKPLENSSELLILDAQNMAGPALARVLLPFNSPTAFHGCYVPASDLS